MRHNVKPSQLTFVVILMVSLISCTSNDSQTHSTPHLTLELPTRDNVKIDQAGLGCAQGQCLWISGSGFGTNCSVRIFAPDWSNGTIPEAVLDLNDGSGLTCSDALVTFVIPPAVVAKYKKMNVNVTNNSLNAPLVAQGNSWSNAVTVSTNIYSDMTFNGQVMSDYYTLGQKKAGLMSDTSTHAQTSEWATNPVSSTHTDIVWAKPQYWPYHEAPNEQGQSYIMNEEWEIKSDCAGGQSFVWLNAYRNDWTNGLSYRYPIKTTRAEIQIGNGAWFDITAGGSCGTDGQPYMLNSVSTTPYKIRVWGTIGKDPKDPTYAADPIAYSWFWQERVTFVENSFNPNWTSDSVTSRMAVKQEEAWWDTINSWAPGAGSMGSDGIPDGIQVNYGRWQDVGFNVGAGWLQSDATGNHSLTNGWTWPVN